MIRSTEPKKRPPASAPTTVQASPPWRGAARATRPSAPGGAQGARGQEGPGPRRQRRREPPGHRASRRAGRRPRRADSGSPAGLVTTRPEPAKIVARPPWSEKNPRPRTFGGKNSSRKRRPRAGFRQEESEARQRHEAAILTVQARLTPRRGRRTTRRLSCCRVGRRRPKCSMSFVSASTLIRRESLWTAGIAESLKMLLSCVNFVRFEDRGPRTAVSGRTA